MLDIRTVAVIGLFIVLYMGYRFLTTLNW
jgi:hypothetical protein